MRTWFVCFLLLVLCSLSTGITVSQDISDRFPELTSLLGDWNWINFTFPSPESYKYYVDQKLYQNCIPTTVKQSPVSGDYFVSFARYRPCPVTFARLRLDTPTRLFEPYPTWKEQGGLPSVERGPTPWRHYFKDLQSVVGFEIDPCNRLWLLDQGVSVGLPPEDGFTKLFVFDLTSSKLLQEYYFDITVDVQPNNSFLTSISVDMKNGYAYITDAGISTVNNTRFRGGLIVYDAVNNIARRVLTSHYSTQPNRTYTPMINGEPVTIVAGANGAGLSTNCELFYFTPLTSTKIYSIPTWLLRNFDTPHKTIAESVTTQQSHSSAAAGIMFDSEHNLWLTALELNGVQRMKRVDEYGSLGTAQLIYHEDEFLLWPESVGFDNSGNVLIVSNQNWRFYAGKMNFEKPSVPNFILWQLSVNGTRGSYMMPWKHMCSIT